MIDYDMDVAGDTLFDHPTAEPPPRHPKDGAADDRQPETTDAFHAWAATGSGSWSQSTTSWL